jgi:hypothetical protein
MAPHVPDRLATAARAFGVAVTVLGLLVLAVPSIIFPVCGVGRYAPLPGESIGHHGCHATLYAEIVIGLVVASSGLVAAIRPSGRKLTVLSIAVLVLAALVAAFPTLITGVCKVPTMPCRLGTVPALVITAVLVGATAAAGLLASRRGR